MIQMSAAIIQLFWFYVSYLFAWMAFVIFNIYPSPAWGGEAVFSFYFLIFITLPDALTIISLRKVITPLASRIFGVVTLVTIVPKIFLVKYIMSIFGLNTFFAFFATLSIAEFILSYSVFRGVYALGRH